MDDEESIKKKRERERYWRRIELHSNPVEVEVFARPLFSTA